MIALMTESSTPDRSRSFGAAADLYDDIRPRYAEPALRWLLAPLTGDRPGGPPLRLVDLGAGTGILTRQLLTLGHQVLAVEPDAGMRAKLTATTPAATALAGSAEEIPVPTGSVDGVLAGQAYHWFDRGRAHAEIARVVRPGGLFGPVWNIRDQSVPWTLEYTRVIKGEEDTPGIHQGQLRDPDFGPGFGPVESASFAHHTEQTPAGLERLMRSRSYYLVGDPDRQAEQVTGLRRLLASHPDLAGRDQFPMRYQTMAYRAVRVG